MTHPQTMPAIRRSDRPTTLKSHAGWASALTSKAGRHSHDSAIQAAISFHRGLTDGWDALEQVRQSRNPKDTAAEHLSKVDRSVKTILETYSRRLDGVLDTIGRRREALKSEISERLGVSRSDEVAEFRQMMRSLPSASERGEILARAIDQGDTVAMSALMMTQTPTLLGVTAESLAGYRKRAINRHAPDLEALDSALADAQSLVIDSQTDSVGLSSLATGDVETRQRFAQEAESADAAALQFAKALA